MENKGRRARGIGLAANLNVGLNDRHLNTANAATQYRDLVADRFEHRARAKWARALMIKIFGWRHGKALLQANFVDRQPSAPRVYMSGVRL